MTFKSTVVATIITKINFAISIYLRKVFRYHTIEIILPIPKSKKKKIVYIITSTVAIHDRKKMYVQEERKKKDISA